MSRAMKRAGSRALRRQRGAMAVTMPFVLVGVLAIGAVAVDLGHLFVARAELQTAADAAALAGAASLMPGTASGPDWNAAQSAARNAAGLNTSDGVPLHDASVQTGYWNLQGSPAAMQPVTIVPGTYDTPAVRVTVSRAPGVNGGPVGFFLARIFGVNGGAVSASAVAMVSAPGSIAPGHLFPMAMATCLYSEYWDAQTGSPKIDPTTGAAYEISFGAGPDNKGCDTGQWTSFDSQSNNVPTVRALIDSGNPASLSIGEPIWIVPGAKATLYSSVPTNVDVLVPVVNEVASSSQPIVAFAAFHIDAAEGKSGKYVQGHFISGYRIDTLGDGQVGPYYGAYEPPRLAQ